MAIQHWDPVRDLSDLKHRVNRLFDETFSRSGSGQSRNRPVGYSPPTDLYEESDRYILRADLPGVTADDVDIKIDEDTLVLRGERRRDAGVEPEAFLRIERPHGRFAVEIVLAPSVDRQGIRAIHRNGILEVVLPKKRDEVPSRIEVAQR